MDPVVSNGESVEKSKSSDSTRGTRETSVSAVRLPMEEPDITQLKDKKIRDVYIKVYDARSTIFSNQKGSSQQDCNEESNTLW